MGQKDETRDALKAHNHPIEVPQAWPGDLGSQVRILALVLLRFHRTYAFRAED
jgi:hypothetical protein